MKYGAVIIETRNLTDLPFIIEGHMSYLPDTWGLTIFHGKYNGKVLKEHFHEANFIDLECETLNHETLNRLLTSTYFWNQIPYDKILMFHPDSRILRKGIEEFLEWDYIGAPWASNESGGNGALSIRDKKATLRLIEHLPYKGYKIHDNEDRWVSNNLHLVGGKIAPRDICFKFSCETIFCLKTFGFHAIEKYLTKEECHQILNQYDRKFK